MASAAEAMGMALPGSSSYPAQSQEKQDECASVGPYMRRLIEKSILPRDIMTRSAFENAMVRFVQCHLPAVQLRTIVGPHDDHGRLYQRSAASDRRRSLRRDQTRHRRLCERVRAHPLPC